MANRIVEDKEFRLTFVKEVASVCDFSVKKLKHCLGIGARQMTINAGVEIAALQMAKFSDEGRTLDKSMLALHTPKGLRSWVSKQLNSLNKVKLVRGANAIETTWKSLGEIIVVARRGNENVYVAKNGATAMELASFIDLRSGKLSAKIKNDEELIDAISRGREAIGDRCLGEAYAETCTEYFKALPAAE